MDGHEEALHGDLEISRNAGELSEGVLIAVVEALDVSYTPACGVDNLGQLLLTQLVLRAEGAYTIDHLYLIVGFFYCHSSLCTFCDFMRTKVRKIAPFLALIL